jgi:hypothetical protein
MAQDFAYLGKAGDGPVQPGPKAALGAGFVAIRAILSFQRWSEAKEGGIGWFP